MNIDSKYQSQVTTQSYVGKDKIAGVQLVELKHFPTEDGSFLEIARFTEDGRLKDLPEFKPKQISQSVMLPGAIKALHLHYKQSDVWFVNPSHQLLVGLLDVREDSTTKDVTMRLTLGGGKAYLLFIPPGVAHGCMNLTQEKQFLTYFTDQYFDVENPDEQRLPHTLMGENFWGIIPG